MRDRRRTYESDDVAVVAIREVSHYWGNRDLGLYSLAVHCEKGQSIDTKGAMTWTLTHKLHPEGIAEEVLRGLIVDRALNGSKDPNAVALLHVVTGNGATSSVCIRDTFKKIVSFMAITASV